MGYRRDVAWQGSLTTVIVIIMSLVLWFFILFTRAGCAQCRHGEEKVSIPPHEHAVNAGLDRISAVVNMEEHY